MSQPRTVRVLGVPVDEVTEIDVMRFVADRVDSREPAQIATVNAEYVMRARADDEFRRILEQADLRTADGVGVVLAARRRGLSIKRRVGGSDLVWTLSRQAVGLGHRVFLLGAAEGVAKQTGDVLQERYPGLELVGSFSGSPFHPQDSEQIRLITEAKPDILMVAFGSPQQDIWIQRVKNTLGVPVIIGVGGSFDYVAGVAKRAPRWMQDAGLDWLFRLIRQPWRWKRMSVLPTFAVLALTRSD